MYVPKWSIDWVNIFREYYRFYHYLPTYQLITEITIEGKNCTKQIDNLKDLRITR